MAISECVPGKTNVELVNMQPGQTTAILSKLRSMWNVTDSVFILKKLAKPTHYFSHLFFITNNQNSQLKLQLRIYHRQPAAARLMASETAIIQQKEWQSCKKCVICIIGPHAGEGLDEIWPRKTKDITTCGHTLWICMSNQIQLGNVLNACSSDDLSSVWCLFVAPATAGGAKDTKTAIAAKEVSYNEGKTWQTIPQEMSPVTGKLSKTGSVAFVFDKMLTKEVVKTRFFNINST